MTGRRSARPRRARLRALSAVCAVAAAVAGCTGVPTSSAPQTIQAVPRENQAPAGLQPYAGEAARQVVTDFLTDNAVDPRQHTAARLYLTTAARNRWTDTAATIVDAERIGNYSQGKSRVVVSGRIVGTLNADGIYTPSNQGVGTGGPEASFVYGIATVHGQYRISNPKQGLLLTVDQFEQRYRPRSLYFFDLNNRYLVPDLRWSALQGLPLEDWLVSELANGPAPVLQSAVNSDTMPAQANTRHFVVTGTQPTKIEIPGSAQLEGLARRRLAAQVGATLKDIVPDETFTITDGGRPVPVTASGGTEFTRTTFANAQGPEPPTADVYYLRGGHIVTVNGTLLGQVASFDAYYLTSIALTRPTPSSGALSIAAVADGRELLIGAQGRGLVKTQVRGELTRPAWAPQHGEVWIGDGSKLYRVLAEHPAAAPINVPLPADVAGGRIVAVRLSAEGTRIALVIQNANGARRLYVGAVVRSGGKVRVGDTLSLISPAGVSINDVAWIEQNTLIATGSRRLTGDGHVYSVNVDGSLWDESGIVGLPNTPNYITVTPGSQVWVSVGQTVWEQENTVTWRSPGPGGTTPGTAPIYLE